MGYRFEIKQLLDEFNEQRMKQGKVELTLQDISDLVGVEHKVLQNLSSNSTLRPTNTRYVDCLCALFRCETSELLHRDPPLPKKTPIHDLIDSALVRLRRGESPQEYFHEKVLYGEKAEREWRIRRQNMKAAKNRTNKALK